MTCIYFPLGLRFKFPNSADSKYFYYLIWYENFWARLLEKKTEYRPLVW